MMYYKQTYNRESFKPVSSNSTLAWKGNYMNRCEISGNEDLQRVFLKENSVILVTEGALDVVFGEAVFRISKGEIATIRENCLIDLRPGVSSDKLLSAGFIRCSINQELVNEFWRVFKSKPFPLDFRYPIRIDRMDENLSKFVLSLEVFFLESEILGGLLIRIKLLELMGYLVSKRLFAGTFRKYEDLESNGVSDVLSDDLRQSRRITAN